MTSSPSWIPVSPFRPCGRDHRTARRPASRGAAREAGHHTWGIFKRRFWGESLRQRHRTFAANAVRLQLHALAYNLGNFMRTLAMPKTAEPWSLTSLRQKLIKIGAKVVSHGRYVTFQLAEFAVPRQMFQEILMLIARLRAPPAPA